MSIIIETERLLLREILDTDLEGMFTLDNNPNVHHYLGKNPILTIDKSQDYINNIRKQYLENGIGRYAVILKETNQFIGWCGIKYITEPENGHVNFYEIGYRFIEAFWGKGFGYESAKAWLDYGFNTMNIKTIYASAHVDNKGSRHILEKLGMQTKNEFEWNKIPCIWFELENKQHTMTTIKIAGVPEHFNLPWHLALENNEFEQQNIDLQWTDVPEGTGKMCQMLRSGETDIAVILTEGIVKDIVAGNPSRIVQVYVDSPLIWGIHVAANSSFHTIPDLEYKKAAISRLGSGSQLMAYVNAGNENWDTANLEFEIVNTIDGAVEALTAGTADYFMWERFMTKPLVDKGIFRRVGDCPTPWPCFVIAVREEVLEKQPEIIQTILKIINNKTENFKEIPNIDSVLAKKYHQKTADIQEWLSLTDWSQKPLSKNLLNNVQNQLFDLKIIDKKGTFDEIVKTI